MKRTFSIQNEKNKAKIENNEDKVCQKRTKKINKHSEMEKAVYHFSSNLWKSHMKAFELHQIMRTEHQQFVEVLHRLRNLRHLRNEKHQKIKKIETMKPEDVKFLNDNCKADISDPDYDPLALHIFYKNAQVNEQNKIALETLQKRGYTLEEITAKDSFVDSTFVNDGTKATILLGLKDKSPQITGQLRYKLFISKNCRVSLTTNISVKDGLVNGAMGTVKFFTKTSTGNIHIVWVEFDEKNNGSEVRKNNNGLYHNNKQLLHTWTPIMAIYKQFQTGARGRKKYYLVSRIQFPLEVAFARTLTKMQGMSLDIKHYIDFEDLRKHNTANPTQHNEPNAYVVGLSRATNPSNLRILKGFKESQIGRSMKADDEIDRLRYDPSTRIVFQVPDLREMDGTKIVFYNMQGLRSENKAELLKKDTNLMETDYLLGAESNLTHESTPDQYNIPGFYSKPLTGNRNIIGRGLIFYSKQAIIQDNLQQNLHDDVEYGQYEAIIERNRLVMIFMYRSQKYNIQKFRHDLNVMVDHLKEEGNILIIGDMNSEENLIDSKEYHQLIKSPTTSGLHGRIIDQAYVKLTDFTATGHVLYKSFIKSYHHPICINLQIKQK
jgi:hypothetical protein